MKNQCFLRLITLSMLAVLSPIALGKPNEPDAPVKKRCQAIGDTLLDIFTKSRSAKRMTSDIADTMAEAKLAGAIN
jgi:hypothetical protein